jgi:hypothetical protein
MTTTESDIASTQSTGEAAVTSDKITSPITVDEAEAVYLKRIQDARKEFESSRGKREKEAQQKTVPKNDAPEASDEEDDDRRRVKEPEASDDSDSDEDPKPTQKDGEEDEVKYADDTAKVRVKVGDEELVVDVKDLKRLYGQESALTKRSQEIATRAKEYEAKTTQAVTALDKMQVSAKKAFEPYEKIDWAQAARSLSQADYNQLRADAQDAQANLRFITEELDAQMKGAKDYAETEMRRLATEAGKQLKDQASPHYIDGWSKELYGKMRDFASEAGLKNDVFDTIVDPAALKIVHDAMQYRAQKAKVKAVVTQAKAKVVSDKQLSPKSTESSDVRDKAAMSRLQESGSVDDAAAVYLARLKARRASSER